MSELKTLETIEFKTVELFETWLENNYDISSGLWLKIFKKDSGIETISYAQALDVALCFGWIDGQKQSFDQQAWLQKFCPRTAKSIWSKVNIGHVERLIHKGKMRAAGLKAVENAKADGRWEKAYDPPSKMTIPADFLNELNKNKKAADFFNRLNKSNLYAIGFKLQTAKKQETREKRIKGIIEKLAKEEKLQ
ncbi:MAG: YdeI/OmpD-associated family protein [Bacteroidetes bacterium]|nr:YdeI/OmpD-associated family protein [Bacteroidota bacterium]